MADHALLSASSAYRWINCPASARLTENMPDTAGEAAAEGTLAHEICELHIRKQYIEPAMSTRTFNARLKKLREDERYSAEMLEGAELYRDTINELCLLRSERPYVAAEVRVDYSEYAPEGFGTSDCVIIGGGRLDVVDYKYGKGHVVKAENNPQLMLYALGALARYAAYYAVDVINLTIVQPRAGGVSDWQLSRDALEAWGESIKPTAQAAFDGTGECRCGDWCDKGFCKLRATCRVRADEFLRADFADTEKPLPELSDAEIGAALSRAEELRAWVARLEEYTLSAILTGREIAGWKAVEGRSNRIIADVDAAFAALEAAGFARDLLYERRPLGITALEKLCGAKKFAEIAGAYIDKPAGKPTLVPVSDSRPAYHSAAEDFGDQSK